MKEVERSGLGCEDQKNVVRMDVITPASKIFKGEHTSLEGDQVLIGPSSLDLSNGAVSVLFAALHRYKAFLVLPLLLHLHNMNQTKDFPKNFPLKHYHSSSI